MAGLPFTCSAACPGQLRSGRVLGDRRGREGFLDWAVRLIALHNLLLCDATRTLMKKVH